ncbi:MAG: TIR domain-containing protein [Gammaproteobacteria bacterium]|nr:TIR domain-containing protein [Gammaproteobacteria bacterium]
MSQENPIRIFVSHVWQPDDAYFRLLEYLESTGNFYYSNCSAPDQNPGTDMETQRACLRGEIEKSEVVIFLSGLFATHGNWMDFQLNAARAMKKPIIALPPFGGEGVPEILADKASEIAEWNPRSIEDSIRRSARHEETQRWDVIEWDPD